MLIIFKERLLEVWSYIKGALFFILLVVTGTGFCIGILKLLEISVLGKKGVEYLLIGMFSLFIGGIMILILVGTVWELTKQLKQFINWLFIEPYKAKSEESKF